MAETAPVMGPEDTAGAGAGTLSPEAMPRTVVVGMGRTGLSCARFLAARGELFAVVDSRPSPPELATFRQELPGIGLRLGPFVPALLARARTLVVSPGVSVQEPAIAEAARAGAELIGDIELFARHCRAPVIAVTGSNGKSTVTTLVGDMARDQGRDVRVGGNLGTPALELLRTTEPELYVLELSSFQLETTRSLHPAAATVLNVSPDHMDRYPDLRAYVQAKRRIFAGSGVMVLNRDDPVVAAMASPGREIFGFTLGVAQAGDFGLLCLSDGPWLAVGQEPLLALADMPLRGLHNAANALAALALGRAVGLSMPQMLRSLRSFKGLPHRCQWVGGAGGVDWYNDSKGTNVGAAVAAIEGLATSGRLVLIAGGDGKGADFAPLREAVAAHVHAVVLIGRDGPRIAAALDGTVPLLPATGMDEAVATARRLARPGDAVLLSPACASFDMFTDYRARGDAFAAAVARELRT